MRITIIRRVITQAFPGVEFKRLLRSHSYIKISSEYRRLIIRYLIGCIDVRLSHRCFQYTYSIELFDRRKEKKKKNVLFGTRCYSSLLALILSLSSLFFLQSK